MKKTTHDGFGTNSKNATIDDVARMAGVSLATVSRVINKNVPVSPDVEKRVKEAIATLHYVPNSAARGLAKAKKDTIGLLVPEISGEFFLPLLNGIESAASKAGYSLLICTTNNKEKSERSRMLGEHNTDGLLVFSDSLPEKSLRQIYLSGFPCVLIYQNSPVDADILNINIDNKGGAERIINHLITAHNKRRIVCLEGPHEVNDAKWRLEGYKKVLIDHGLDLDPALIIAGEFSAIISESAIGGLLKRGIFFDSVFSGDDESALGVIKALREAGKRVPEDIAVVGFDDLDFACHITPALTTMRAPTRFIGEEAVKMLIRMIQHEEVISPDPLSTELIVRQSCGCNLTK